MCLIDTKRFRFTFKRIPIVKIVINGNQSPYFHYVLKHNNFTLNGFPEKQKNQFVFGKGFFHAYELNACKKLYPKWLLTKDIQGYIPAFTRYAINNETGEICARRLILKL